MARIERFSTELLVELHVYVMPPDLWREHLHSAINQIVGETISAGFIRILPDAPLQVIRGEIAKQLGFEIIPRHFVFLRSIGRCFTTVKPKQEQELRAKHFMPPVAYVPELFVLDEHAALRTTPASSVNNDIDEEELERFRLAELMRKQKEEEEERRRRLAEEERRRRLKQTEEDEEERRRKEAERRRREEEALRAANADYEERMRIEREMERLRQQRIEMENSKDDLTTRIAFLQTKLHGARNKARDVWKKKYFDEKKKTPAVEERTARLRKELQDQHRKISDQLQSLMRTDGGRRLGEDTVSKQLAMKLAATSYEHGIEDLHNKLQNVKMRLTVEMKLRDQSECELQALRTELAQLKLNVMMARSHVYDVTSKPLKTLQP